MKKQERILIINTIIEEISKRGRRFFYSNKTGKTAKLLLRNNRLYYLCEYKDTPIGVNVPDCKVPRYWSHGGTMWALVKDFRDFVNNGGDTNHNHGYGGLFCPHWGYPEEDMIAIREKAYELGYLKSATVYKK